MLDLGTALVDITPTASVPLCGFAARLDPWHRVQAPLSAQVFGFGDGTSVQAVLVCADLLWWSPDTFTTLRTRLAESYDLPAERFVLHASHTHSAPTPGLTHSGYIGAGDPDYVGRLIDSIVDAVGQAIDVREPVTLVRVDGECDIGINRRRPNPDGTNGGPYPNGLTDNEVSVLRFDRTNGTTKAVLVHYTCHPVIAGDPHDVRVTPDYPGAMREHLATLLDDDPVVGFLQGCSGDVNPCLVDDSGEFYRGSDHEIVELGGRLADAAAEALRGPARPLGTGRVEVSERTAELPLQEPSRHRLARQRHEPGIWGEWAGRLLDEPERLVEKVPLRLSTLRLTDRLALLGFDAEVTVPYSHYVKQASDGVVLPIGYTNGMIGYVVTDEQVRAGGYEPDDSYPYIFRPGRFAPGVERAVKVEVDAALEWLEQPVEA